ncbi:hybrid sensor histidine kinase/response regulator [Pseudoalteromonas luteoviolacea]|uniref:histidine kinase n=1 Tax=Pseudoalteromonas luteoviolacea NCIMB 1942 TaxID=1365253 RepID=A0A167BBC1_9GAMM|nr:hybrid sensor histidine kinase/response regulator [Pseudoalteromonas luteoviolacea]KZN46338.1 chemotaxis protein CheY [Pseudoalteromonas luteoviolacea NCIMB 1942]
MKTSKLSIRLLWYITPLVILPLLFLGGFTLTNVTSSTQKQAKLIVSRFVEQQQQKMFNYMEIYQSTTKLLSTSPVLSDFLLTAPHENQTKTKRLGALMDVFASYSEAYPDIISINLVDSQGNSAAFYSSNLSFAPEEYPFFDQVIKSNLRQQQYMLPAKEGGTQLYFVQQIYSVNFHLKRPQRQGYIIVQVAPSIISSSILEAPYDNTLNLLVSGQGEVLFSSDGHFAQSYLSDQEMAQISSLADRGKLDSIVLPSVDELKRMTYSAQLSGGYYYISTIPKSILYQSGKAISLITALIVILSVVTLPVLIFIVVRNLLLTPIELLGEASHRVGDGDLSVFLPAHEDDEVGTLFDDFNHMVKQIRDFQGELEDYKLHLEEKVENRTRALEEMNQQLEVAITEAEQANQLKSRFLANMSHEIRTPLTAIMGFTEQLLHNPQAKNAELHLDTILRNSKHLLELINNILDLSKIEAEKLEVEQKEIEFLPLLKDVESIILPMAEEKQLDFMLDYNFPLPKVLNSDETRLKQILLNIASNAVKFTEQGSIIVGIDFKTGSGQFVFVVKDTGIGMSESEMERVFKPFEQADTTTTRRFGGTGLGLCISKSLAQLLGGDVQVASEQGNGSVFSISIAANHQTTNIEWIDCDSYIHNQISSTQELAEKQLEANILLAEDNKDNQELITLLLNTWGLVPDIANNGAEAVEMSLVNDYDLILMDMQMPVMGGLEATDMLRHAAYDGPIVALTANIMKNDIDNYLAAGCDATLGKPIDREKLGAVLLEFLQVDNDNLSKWNNLLESEKFLQISQNYLEKLPEQMELVESLYCEQDWESLRALAHSLKGSAGCFGFKNIHSAAGELENSLRDNNKAQWQYATLSLVQAIKYTLSNEEVQLQTAR